MTTPTRPTPAPDAASPPDAIAQQYRDALPPGEVGTVDLSGVDRLGVGVVSADSSDPSGRWPRAAGFGYGADAAWAGVGALAEMAEELLLSRLLVDTTPVRASYAELRRSRGADRVADPVSLVLPAGTAYSPDRPLWWLPTTRHRSGEEVLVPAEFVASDPGDLAWQPAQDRLITPITNGSGAGAGDGAVVRALGHALGELLQRDGNAVAHRAVDPGVVVDTAGVSDPEARALLDRCDAAGVDVLVKLADTVAGMAVVTVVGVDRDPDDAPHPLALAGGGEAAHPDRDVALRKALREFAHSRTRKAFAFGPLDAVRPLAPADYWAREFAHPVPPQERRAFETTAAWAAMTGRELRDLLSPTVLAEHRRVRVEDLPTVPAGSLDDPTALLDDLLRRLDGMDDLPRPDGGAGVDVLTVLAPGPDPHDPASAAAVSAKVIVPGLEVETVSYGRIGARGVARLLARESPLVGLGDPPHAGAVPVALTAAGRERLGGPAWLDRDALHRVADPLYPLYREPSRHAIAREAAGEDVPLL